MSDETKPNNTQPAQSDVQNQAQVQSNPPAAQVQDNANEGIDTSSNAAASTGASTEQNPYEAIIAQKDAQIEALLNQNQLQNEQIVRMIQGGAQLNNNQAAAQQPAQSSQPIQQIHGNDFNPVALSSGKDVSLEGLASEIGKDRATH